MTLRTLILALFAFPSFVVAQEHQCGSAQVNNIAILNDPAKAQLQHDMQIGAKEFTENYANNRGGVKVIPVVIHIMHNGGSENISRNQVLAAIDIINDDFRLQNSDNDQIVEEFNDIKADILVEFRLATIDPDGNCTSGITRTKTPLTFDAGENVKDLISWNTSRYLNIWVVDNIASGAGGYAYYPGNAPGQSHEGIVIRNAQFGGIGTGGGSNFSRRSLTHEIGHFFNLAHTWGSTNENAVEQNCSFDDGVDDTPNTIGSAQNCVIGQTTCGSLDNVQNYMDYSTCGKMFTLGQAARMNFALISNDAGPLGPYRNNLWQQSNLEATGTNLGFVNVCAPIADFTSNKKQVCLGTEIQFSDASYNAEVDESWNWSWTFEGGNPSTSSVQNPTVVYNDAGVHAVSLTVSNNTGSDSKTYNDLITVSGTSSNTDAPFFEGMEQSEWPENPSNPILNWFIENPSGTTWQRTETTSHWGNACTKINLRTISEGAIHSLISQPYNFSEVSMSEAKMSFWYAHSPKSSSGNSQERLRIYASKNCGENWSTKFSRSGNSLNTTTETHSNNFVPEDYEWEFVELNLTGFDSASNVLIKFEAKSDRESYLYIDDINIGTSVTSIESSNLNQAFSFYPNPANDQIRITTELENVTTQIFDLTGKMVYSDHYQSSGTQTVNVGHLSKGLYTIRFEHADGVSVQKLVISK